MIYKKVRGLKRRKKNILDWKEAYINLDISTFKENKKDYVKIWVEPWSNLFCNATPPFDYRCEIINGLIEIFNNWNNQLSKLKEPYYLKIWLFDPRYMQSQVVAAIGENINYYKEIFRKVEKPVSFPLNKFQKTKNLLSQFNWDECYDEDSFLESDFIEKDSNGNEIINNEDRKFLEKLRKNYDRKETVRIPQKETVYFKIKGKVWVGGISS